MQKSNADPLKNNACLVMYVTFADKNVRTFYSRDVEKQKNNTWFWLNHLSDLIEQKWKGQVEQAVIYRAVQGKPAGDPVKKWDNLI